MGEDKNARLHQKTSRKTAVVAGAFIPDSLRRDVDYRNDCGSDQDGESHKSRLAAGDDLVEGIVMNPLLLELMKLQGGIRVAFVRMGIEEDKALDLSAEALHLFMESEVVKDEYLEAYRELSGAISV